MFAFSRALFKELSKKNSPTNSATQCHHQLHGYRCGTSSGLATRIVVPPEPVGGTRTKRRKRSSLWLMAREVEKAEKRPGYDGTKEHPGRQIEPRRRKGSIAAFLKRLAAAPEPPWEFASGCSLANPTRSSAAECLRGQRLVFIGDCVMRYQYLSLVHFLETGSWGPRIVAPQTLEQQGVTSLPESISIGCVR